MGLARRRLGVSTVAFLHHQNGKYSHCPTRLRAWAKTGGRPPRNPAQNRHFGDKYRALHPAAMPVC